MWGTHICSTILTSILLVLLSLSHVLASQFSISLTNKTENCGQYQNFNTSNGRYQIQTNGWGFDGNGSQCVTVGDNNERKSAKTAFSATWGWSSSPYFVHAYPNIEFLSQPESSLPVQLQNLTSLMVSASWSYEGGNEVEATGKSNFTALADVGTKANVAIDLFVDADPGNSTTTTKPKYEIMVWLGIFGGVNPLGYMNGSQAVEKIRGNEFNLYIGNNSNNQTVFSWLPSSNLTSFSADISSLVRAVTEHGGPNTTDYLGVIQFGTEALHTNDAANVTFTAKSVAMSFTKGIAPIGIDSSAMTYNAGNVLPLVLFISLWLNIGL